MPLRVGFKSQPSRQGGSDDSPGKDHKLVGKRLASFKHDRPLFHGGDAVVVPHLDPQGDQAVVGGSDQEGVHAVEYALVGIDQVDVQGAASEVPLLVKGVGVCRHLGGDLDARKAGPADDDVERIGRTGGLLRSDPVEKRAFELLFQCQRGRDALDAVGVFGQTGNEVGKVGTAPGGEDQVVVGVARFGGFYPLAVEIDAVDPGVDETDPVAPETGAERFQIHHHLGHVDFVCDEVVDFRLHVVVRILVNQRHTDPAIVTQPLQGADPSVTTPDNHHFRRHGSPSEKVAQWYNSFFKVTNERSSFVAINRKT